MELALYHALKRVKSVPTRPDVVRQQDEPKIYPGVGDSLYGIAPGAAPIDDYTKTSGPTPPMDQQHGDVPDAETSGNGAKWRQPSGGAGTAPNPRDYFKPDAPPSLVLEQISPAVHSDDRTPK